MKMVDLWLIYRCQRGDPEAYAWLYRRHYRTVFRTALHLVRDRALAEDITQEAFVTAFGGIGQLRSPAAFRTWLYRLVVSRTTRFLRSEGGARRPLSLDLMPELDGPLDPAAAAAEAEELRELRAAIRALPEEFRLPVVLHYFSGLSVAEVARVLEIPPGTVKSRLYHARGRLARLLKGEAGAGQHESAAKEISL